jgi:hypothetical protein
MISGIKRRFDHATLLVLLFLLTKPQVGGQLGVKGAILHTFNPTLGIGEVIPTSRPSSPAENTENIAGCVHLHVVCITSTMPSYNESLVGPLMTTFTPRPLTNPVSFLAPFNERPFA